MAFAIQWLRSLLFAAQVYGMMVILSVALAPWALFDRRGAFAAVHLWCGWVRWTASWMIGLRSEVRGEVPVGEVMIAAKHQSFFDIIMLCSVLPRPKFIMKKQLIWAPIVGWYALRIGCVPVDRGRRGAAIKAMVERGEIGVAADGLVSDEDLRDGAPAGGLDQPPAGVGVIGDVDIFEGHAFLGQQALGLIAVPADARGVHLDGRHLAYLRRPGCPV